MCLDLNRKQTAHTFVRKQINVSRLCTDQRIVCKSPSKIPLKKSRKHVVGCNNTFFVQLYQLDGANGVFIEFR